MSASSQPEFRFDEEEKKLIKNYVKESYVQLTIATDLRKHLEARNIIDDSTTHDELIANTPLMEGLHLLIGESLATTPPKSKFGLGKFSDLELYKQCRNDEGLNALVNGKLME